MPNVIVTSHQAFLTEEALNNIAETTIGNILSFFENDGMSALNLNLNLHYVIRTSESFAIYPLLGFSYGHYKTDFVHGDASVDRCGANVGMGAQYRIKDRLHFFTEERFQIMKNFNQSVTVLGFKYTF